MPCYKNENTVFRSDDRRAFKVSNFSDSDQITADELLSQPLSIHGQQHRENKKQ